MYKTFSVLALVVCVTVAAHPFSAYHNISWDSDALAWRVDDEVLGEINVAGGQIALFNITAGGGDFFISSRSCALGNNYALSRKDGVTNNACTPPCVVAMNLTTGSYFYCSSLYPNTATGLLFVLNCDECSKRTCDGVVGCGYNSEAKKCVSCISAKTEGDCEKISACEWCKTEDMCLHRDSGACRAPIARERAVASWVWLLITLCALLVLIAVVLTLFLSEASFKKRWATLSKTDKDFAEVGRGNNDGLLATD